jgi:hypothetical protein
LYCCEKESVNLIRKKSKRKKHRCFMDYSV